MASLKASSQMTRIINKEGRIMAYENISLMIDSETMTRNNQDGSVVVMKLDESNSFFKINGVAASIWKQLNENVSLSEAYQNILNEFHVAEEKLSDDIDALLETLKKKDLIKLKN